MGEEITIKVRMLALADTLLDDNDPIPAAFLPVVKKLLHNYLDKATDDQIKAMLEKGRDQIIPFLLTGAVPDDPGEADPA